MELRASATELFHACALAHCVGSSYVRMKNKYVWIETKHDNNGSNAKLIRTASMFFAGVYFSKGRGPRLTFVLFGA